MPKTTASGWGAEGTNALVPEYFEEQEKRWPGKASSKSTKKPGSSPKKKPAAAQSPAQKTEPPSKKTQPGSSIAGSAGSSPSKGDK